jgi:hypothetical protein
MGTVLKVLISPRVGSRDHRNCFRYRKSRDGCLYSAHPIPVIPWSRAPCPMAVRHACAWNHLWKLGVEPGALRAVLPVPIPWGKRHAR